MPRLALILSIGLLTGCGASNAVPGATSSSPPACAIGQAALIYPLPNSRTAPTTDVYYAVSPYVVLFAFGQGAVFAPNVTVSEGTQVKAAQVPSPHAQPGFAKATYFKVHAGFASSTTYALSVEAQFDPSPEIGPCFYKSLGSFTTS